MADQLLQKPETGKSNLAQRTLTGAVLIAIISGCVGAGAYTFVLLVLLLNLLGLLEFYRLFQAAGVTPRKVAGLVVASISILVLALVFLFNLPVRLLLLTVPLVFLVFVQELYLTSEKPFENLAYTFLGILFVSIPLSFFLGTAFLPWPANAYQRSFILGYFFLLWASDSGAYLFGRWLGRHKLFERISPHKSWEGSAGGACCALLVAFLNAQLFHIHTLTHWLSIAILVVVFGTYGDLFKSMMKRSLAIKDSGTILPGHGGILDRFDSLLGSAPFVFLYLILTLNE
ncbi:phosphatidate cytidylyltransferase [Pontibacter ruber]|uniref:Phosphatidate cytidylyltransferase n=1 Tax=Pontibacter ruber TaxID=1343895 RepID=A0ABW5CZV4_9BACT|nr:phosphatidate cytidylyltransferase [Pontibacter ruber]